MKYLLDGFPRRDGDEFEEARDFVRYLLVIFGIIFALIFQSIMDVFLRSAIFGAVTMSILFAGTAVYFAVHAYSLTRLLILYTHHKIKNVDDLIVFVSAAFPQFVQIAAGHLFCIFLPCLIIATSRREFDGIIQKPHAYINFIFFDVAMLIALCYIGWKFQSEEPIKWNQLPGNLADLFSALWGRIRSYFQHRKIRQKETKK